MTIEKLKTDLEGCLDEIVGNIASVIRGTAEARFTDCPGVSDNYQYFSIMQKLGLIGPIISNDGGGATYNLSPKALELYKGLKKSGYFSKPKKAGEK